MTGEPAELQRTPLHELHLDENRLATVQVDVAAELRTPTDWGALGYFTGKGRCLDPPI